MTDVSIQDERPSKFCGNQTFISLTKQVNMFLKHYSVKD